jgi:Domain of unknown function (DUF4112)
MQVPRQELAFARWLARNMDNAPWSLGPIRLGLESALRLIPLLGGASSGLVSLYQFLLAVRLRLPGPKLIHIVLNGGLDLGLALIPWVGDVLDSAFRVHVRNQAIIDRYLASARQKTPSQVRPVRGKPRR